MLQYNSTYGSIPLCDTRSLVAKCCNILFIFIFIFFPYPLRNNQKSIKSLLKLTNKTISTYLKKLKDEIFVFLYVNHSMLRNLPRAFVKDHARGCLRLLRWQRLSRASTFPNILVEALQDGRGKQKKKIQYYTLKFDLSLGSTRIFTYDILKPGTVHTLMVLGAFNGRDSLRLVYIVDPYASMPEFTS